MPCLATSLFFFFVKLGQNSGDVHTSCKHIAYLSLTHPWYIFLCFPPVWGWFCSVLFCLRDLFPTGTRTSRTASWFSWGCASKAGTSARSSGGKARRPRRAAREADKMGGQGEGIGDAGGERNKPLVRTTVVVVLDRRRAGGVVWGGVQHSTCTYVPA